MRKLNVFPSFLTTQSQYQAWHIGSARLHTQHGPSGRGSCSQLCSDTTRERAAHPSCHRQQSQRNQTNPASAISFWLTIRGNTGVTLGELQADTQNQAHVSD